MAEIKNIQEAWEGHSGLEVESFVKAQFGEKYGVIRISETINEQNFYSLEMFSTKEDEALYDGDPETYAHLITKVAIPISAVQGDSYMSLLSAQMPSTNIVVTEGRLEVPLNYRSVKISVLGKENMGAVGTLHVQTSTNNGQVWNEVGVKTGVLNSREFEDSENYADVVDIGSYLVEGKQLVRVRASFDVEDDVTGQKKTMYSSWVAIGTSVTKTALKLELETNFAIPMDAKDENGNYKPMTVSYRTYGAVNKTLHVEVKGAKATNKSYSDELSADVDGLSVSASFGYDPTYDYHSHGVREIVAWLEAEDGLGNTIKSDVLTNQFMMVADASSMKKYLLLQNVKSEVTNYIQSRLCDYAVYAPDGSDTELTFSLQDTDGGKYTELIKIASPNTRYSLDATIEIEPTDEGNIPTGYDTRFYVFRDGGNNFIQESGVKTGGYYYFIRVDNTEAIVPIQGATFLLNPKNRDNSEANPKRILNARANNAVVDSTWENFGFINDGWIMNEGGEKVLRIMAGEKLTIKRNVWKQFMTNPEASLNIDIDFKVSNVTDVDNPVIQIQGASDGRGLTLNALKGWVRTNSYKVDDNCMFGWREDKRQFLSLNINPYVRPKGKDCKYPSDKEVQSNGTIALARVLLNGDLVRELDYKNTATDEWCADADAAIVIGNDGADVDIYSIRIYENDSVKSLPDLLNRNYLSSLPTTEEKQHQKQRNDLMMGGRITLAKAQALGLNCIVYHGTRPYHYGVKDASGWIEYFRYDQNKQLMKEYSGTNCKSTSIGWKSQGSTAESYYEFNIQDDNSKNKYNFAEGKGCINVAIADFHESIVVGAPYEGVIEEETDKGGHYEGLVVDIYGGNLGKNYPLESTGKPYPYVNGKVVVPDGWVDGNGKYRGMGYMVAEGTALAQKKVAKINYASSMQSHLLGACKSYDELHQKCVGLSPLQQQYKAKGLPIPVSAKHTEPFLMFWDEDGTGEAYYTGLCIYGAGKMDKATWGYVKKKHPMFALIEGSDNNLPLTDFLAPFDEDAEYVPSEEGWLYAGTVSFDFDAGATDDNDVPKAEIQQQWGRFHNFVYLNSSNIKYFNGTVEQFRTSSAANDNKNKYWCTQGNKAYHLLRPRFKVEKGEDGKTTTTWEWVDAGLGRSVVDLRTDIRTKATYEKHQAIDPSAYSTINEDFRADMAAFFKQHGKFLMSLKSLLFNYSYVLTFLAGTDNSSKNTYYKIDPIAQDMSAEADATFSAWWSANFGETFNYKECYQVWMDGDDMDSILPLNNKGNLTKPYYLERLYPTADGSSTVLYEGMGNALFNLVEKAYTTQELSAMMNAILTAMCELVSAEDKLYGWTGDKLNVWGCLHKYFFNVQYYFPQICYIEQARIRYEFAELMGHTGARGVHPISQSIGSNVENEQQFMEQRLVYMASFANYGALGDSTKGGAIGISDTTAAFQFQAQALPNGSPATIELTVTPHQYIYPVGFDGQTTRPTWQRTSPKQTCKVYISTVINDDNIHDTTMGLRGANYYSDFGRLEYVSVAGAVSIKGKRLTRVFIPYTANDVCFRPTSLTIDAPNSTNLYCSIVNSALSGALDLSGMKRVSLINLNFVKKNIDVITPQTHTLTSFSLHRGANNLTLHNVPNLNKLAIGVDYSAKTLKSLIIGANVGTNTTTFASQLQTVVQNIYSSQSSQSTPTFTTLKIENAKFTDFNIDVLKWLMGRDTCEIKGDIGIKESGNSWEYAVDFETKNLINAKFGNVDNVNGADYRGLKLTYKPMELTTLTVTGGFYHDDTNWNAEGGVSKEYPFKVQPNSTFANTHTSLTWSADPEQGTNAAYALDAKTGVLTVTYIMDTFEQPVIIKATAQTWMSGNGGTVEGTKDIVLMRREAHLGDLVYADGTFGPVAEYDGSKTPIGVCFYIAPRDSNGDVIATYANPNDKQLRLMVSMEDVKIPVGTSEELSLQWGVYESTVANEGLFDKDASGNAVYLTSDKVSDVYDILSITNLTSSGLSNAYIDPAQNSDYRSTSDEALRYNYGFKLIAADKSVGDGFGYGETPAFVTARTLDDDLAKLAGSAYKSGDIVNSAYAKTLKVIQHRNALLNSNIIGADNEVLIPNGRFPIPYKTTDKTELENLGLLMSSLRAWGKEEFGETDANSKKWSQLAYPLASACYAYEPTMTLKDGEILAERFKAHNWFAPTNGLLARICWYVKYGASQGVGVINEAISKNLLKFSTSSGHWSVTESSTLNAWGVGFYNGFTSNNGKLSSYVGRAVSAF